MSAIANSVKPSTPAAARRARPRVASISPASPQVFRKPSGCACGGGCPRCQKKEEFPMSRRGDASEREADRVADQVMREPVGTISQQSDAQIARSPLADATPSAPAALGDALRGSAQPLDSATRSFFEPRFGRDLSDVRIHNDNRAAESAQSLNAHAYTYGRDIVFGAGQYDPHSTQGQHLLAHELTHVVQQQQSSASVMRQDYEVDENGVTVADNLGCPKKACAGKEDGIRADLSRALTYTDRALGALGSNLSGETERLLDWFFSSHSSGTVSTVLDRLTCIRSALQDTLDHNRFGCGTRSWAHAHTGSSEKICEDSKAKVCLDPSYFDELGARERAEALIHECGHRVGLAAGEVPDIYSEEWRFIQLSTEQALINTESYAHFVGALTFGARTTIIPVPTIGGGRTSVGGNFFKAKLGVELQHPSLRGISPIAGISFQAPSPAVIGSVFLGARIADARPGKKGSVFLNLAGELSYVSGDKTGVGFGGEATLGYRIGQFEIGATGGVLRDPSSEEGKRTVFSGGLSFTFTPDFWMK
jgi:hypothetical protein